MASFIKAVAGAPLSMLGLKSEKAPKRVLITGAAGEYRHRLQLCHLRRLSR